MLDRVFLLPLLLCNRRCQLWIIRFAHRLTPPVDR
jgi:hypothetical protein